jgi:hypothetical protein
VIKANKSHLILPKRGFVSEKLSKMLEKPHRKFLHVVSSNRNKIQAEKRQKVSLDDLVSLLIYLSA